MLVSLEGDWVGGRGEGGGYMQDGGREKGRKKKENRESVFPAGLRIVCSQLGSVRKVQD